MLIGGEPLWLPPSDSCEQATKAAQGQKLFEKGEMMKLIF
jgi:hypothetical protein